MKKQFLRSIILALSAGALTANGAQTIRELWDQLPAGQLQSATNGTTSLGYFPNANVKWVVNPADPAATNVMLINGGNVDDWMIGRYDVLPSTAGVPGKLSLVGGHTNGWDSGSWAVRYLDTPARSDTASDGVYYFSARLIKRSLWWYDSEGGNTNNYGPDDAALGLGFASGSTASSKFVGAGFTRTVVANGGGGYLTEAWTLVILFTSAKAPWGRLVTPIIQRIPVVPTTFEPMVILSGWRAIWGAILPWIMPM